MNLITMTDTRLARLRQDLDNELPRRTAAAAQGYDAAAIIQGNEAAKRALVVAAARGHSILLASGPLIASLDDP